MRRGRRIWSLKGYVQNMVGNDKSLIQPTDLKVIPVCL
jgi:hypothetical protein